MEGISPYDRLQATQSHLKPQKGTVFPSCRPYAALGLILLAAYKYDIRCRPTSAHCNADRLSHLPLVDSLSVGNYEDATVFNVAQLEVMPVQASQVTTANCTNPILWHMLRYDKSDWPDQVSESIHPYWLMRKEIAIEGVCILWGTQIMVPKKLQQNVLEELHMQRAPCMELCT